MEPLSVAILVLIVSAFTVFAVVLAYGDYATRQVRRAREAAAQAEASSPEQRKAA